MSTFKSLEKRVEGLERSVRACKGFEKRMVELEKGMRVIDEFEGRLIHFITLKFQHEQTSNSI